MKKLISAITLIVFLFSQAAFAIRGEQPGESAKVLDEKVPGSFSTEPSREEKVPGTFSVAPAEGETRVAHAMPRRRQ